MDAMQDPAQNEAYVNRPLRLHRPAPPKGAPVVDPPYPGLYADGKILKGELAFDFGSASPREREDLLNKFRNNNFVGPGGYGVNVTFREATTFEKIGRFFGANSVIYVDISRSTRTDTDGEYGHWDRNTNTLKLNSNQKRDTPTHEIGHVFGLLHATDNRSIMFVNNTPSVQNLPRGRHLLESEVRNLLPSYKQKQ